MEDALKRIYDAVAAAERECGLDWRFSYSKLALRGEGAFEIELSREEVWRLLPARLGEVCAATERGGGEEPLLAGDVVVTRRLLVPPGSRRLWVLSSVADVRREPAHSAELLTQLIMGETALPLKAEGDWFLIRCADDYHGWIRSWYVRESDLKEIAAYEGSANAVVDASVGYIHTSPDEKSVPVSDVVAGTVLIAAPEEAGFRSVTLPGGKSGFMRARDLIEKPERVSPDRERLIGRAMRFLGIPYLWGGTTPKGFDCSGFVKRVFGMEGVVLPRDSDRQAASGAPVPGALVEDIRRGDLLFFGEGGKVGHVAISLGKGLFVHAYGDVRINSLTPDDESHDEKFSKIFLFARSVLG